MRIIWRDSSAKTYKPVKYRGYQAEGDYRGWTVNVPGDDNIYKTSNSALNAIDKYYGESGLGSVKRKEAGIEIVGKKDGIA